MKKKIFFITAGLFLGVCTNMFAQNKTSGKVKDIVDSKYLSQLTKEGKIVVTHEDQVVNLELLPKTAYASNIKKVYHLPKTEGRIRTHHIYSVTKSFAPTSFSCKSGFSWHKTQSANWRSVKISILTSPVGGRYILILF